MVEEDVKYASVAFRTKKHSPPKVKKEEETVYEEMKPPNTSISAGLLPDKKTNSRGRCYLQVACCLGILCVILLLGIIAVCVYVNQNLRSQNQELETQRNNLTEQIQIMETTWNQLNVSRAQWSIDAYCPKPRNQNRKCEACQKGWLLSQSSCYVIINPDGVSDQKTWEEAQENCTGKISDLVIIIDETEKTFINDNSWSRSGTNGYWIGLRAEDGKWKWVDGSVLTENSWIQQNATNGQCVISVKNKGWKSVSCGAKNRWICKKKALSV